jgi:hypothetical protein
MGILAWVMAVFAMLFIVMAPIGYILMRILEARRKEGEEEERTPINNY